MVVEWWMVFKVLCLLLIFYKEFLEESWVCCCYVDFVVCEEFCQMVCICVVIICVVCCVFDECGFFEIEILILQLVYGGVVVCLFNIYFNVFDIDMSLCIVFEFYFKWMMVGGIDWVYEMGWVFCNEGIDFSYLVEFFMFEVYMSWGN